MHGGDRLREIPGAESEHLDRLGRAWRDAHGKAGQPEARGQDCARLADLAVATAAVARRLHRASTAEQVMAQSLFTLKSACAAQPTEISRHVAFARVLEAVSTHEQHDARAAFDSLRAAASVLASFAPMIRDSQVDPLVRLSVCTGLLRPLTNAARMLDDAPLRRQTWQRCWAAALDWAEASRGGPDHAQAVEWVVLLAFELAVEELEASAGACLERCEDLRPHLDALDKARGGDAVCLLHRSAFQRLWADAWRRLGDAGEARKALDACAATLDRLEALKDFDTAALKAQRAALARDRARLAEPAQRTSRPAHAGRAASA